MGNSARKSISSSKRDSDGYLHCERDDILRLVNRGYEIDDVQTAANRCETVDEALTFLRSKRECPCCLDTFIANKMITLMTCQHEMCRDCAVQHFRLRIRDHNSVHDVVCPISGCGDDKDKLDHDYFTMLAMQLQGLLDRDDYNLFLTKLCDQIALKNQPFVFCTKCRNAFICPPGLEESCVTCPHCQHVTCPKCTVDWEPHHKGRSCDEVIDILKDNNKSANEESEKLVKNTLDENGIRCPKCKFRFELTRGGCMHFTCTQCKHEFCGGCAREMFKTTAQCKVFADCNQGGLHGHHPRNCYYYLRDYSVDQLQLLLQMNKVKIPARPFKDDNGRCQLVEMDVDGVEQPCGLPSNAKHKGFCQHHYKEHLTVCINMHGSDPAFVMDADGLVNELRRNRKQVPAKVDGETDQAYNNRLRQAVVSQLPLADIGNNKLNTNNSYAEELERWYIGILVIGVLVSVMFVRL